MLVIEAFDKQGRRYYFNPAHWAMGHDESKYVHWQLAFLNDPKCESTSVKPCDCGEM